MIKSKNRLSAVILTVVSVVYLILTFQLPEYNMVPMDSDVIPYVLGVILVVLAILLFFEKDEEENENDVKVDGKSLKILGIIAFYFILYAIAFETIGFIIGSALFIFITTITLGYKKHWVNLIVSIVMPFVFYYVFDLLQITLPSGILPF